MNNTTNSVSLTGTLGQDPEVKSINGKKLATFSIATVVWYKGMAGRKVSGLNWYNAVAWGRMAGFVAEHLKKGMLVTIQGELKSRDYKDKGGIAHHVTEINVTGFTINQRKKKEKVAGPAQESTLRSEK